MSLQNVYDNQTFFEGYRGIRGNKVNANILFEKPALFSLLPDMRNKSILDLGCGYGENCIEFVNRGAKHVVGIDISRKMLAVAENENSDSKITYKNLPMEDISLLDEKFDIVVSSLAVHYVQDFSGLVKNVYKLLNANGCFIFSQENPVNTCFTNGNRWTKDADGKVLFANLSNYSFDGKRESTWFIDHMVKYHRTFSSIINALINEGFSVEKLLEPVPAKEIMEKYPEYKKNIHKPDFLLVKVKKSVS